MNPNAPAFSFNPGASTFTPNGPPATSSVPPEPPVVGTSSNVDDDLDGADIDENDPLWIAVLALKEGDKRAALKLLDDPDALMQYPDIVKILESTGEDNKEDWEADGVTPPPVPSAEIEPAIVVIKENTGKKSSVSVNEEEAATSSKTRVTQKGLSAEEQAAADAAEAAARTKVVMEMSDPREHLNLVFIGHVDAGKSTLSGSILYTMGMVDQRTIERYEREAKDRNRESWFLAFIMDTSEEERAKGKTVEVGRAQFETEQHRYTILDAPGHKNYVPNMISGAAQADVGVLVISARRGEFETGFEKGGQTREHALLAKTLGVRYLLVVINKMDDPTVEWKKERFDECVNKLKPYLKSCGYAIKREVRFVPISGLTGDNIKKEVSESTCPWWKPMYTASENCTSTPTLISTLDSLSMKDCRDPNGPLRIPVLDRYFERGCVVLGKVESGTIVVGDELVMAPTKKSCKVESIHVGEVELKAARPGENVLIKFNMQVEDVQKGYVLCRSNSVVPAVTDIKVHMALVDTLEHRPLFTPGYNAMMHIHTAEVEVTCKKIINVIDKGKEVVRPFVRQGQQATVIFQTPLSTPMELYSDMAALGRFTIRDEGISIAIGKIIGMKRK